jgi:ribosomal protein L37E
MFVEPDNTVLGLMDIQKSKRNDIMKIYSMEEYCKLNKSEREEYNRLYNKEHNRIYTLCPRCEARHKFFGSEFEGVKSYNLETEECWECGYTKNR